MERISRQSTATVGDVTRLFRLDGRTALVIGGASVLGAAVANGLALAGARVALTSRTLAKAEQVADAIHAAGGRALGVALDPLDKSQLNTVLDQVEATLGPVTILFNFVGGNTPEATVTDTSDFFGLEEGALHDVIELNLFAGVILPCQVVGRRMAARGEAASIVNISSVNDQRPLTRIPGYSAAKAGVSNFTRWLAVYMARELESNVRVNAIAPGVFLADQNRRLLLDDANGLTERGAQIVAHTPMGRFGAPEELVGVAVWLASEASSFVTGAVIAVDGGFSAFAGV